MDELAVFAKTESSKHNYRDKRQRKDLLKILGFKKLRLDSAFIKVYPCVVQFCYKRAILSSKGVFTFSLS